MTDTSSSLNCCALEDRTLIRVSGQDARTFLQNLVTCEIAAMKAGDLAHGALLTPQGKILFDFFVLAAPESLILDADRSTGADLMRRLQFYRLRAKVDIEPMDPRTSVFALWPAQGASTSAETLEADGVVAADPRLPAMGWRAYLRHSPQGVNEVPASEYDAHRIALGMPAGGRDFAFGDAFPHEALMDQFGGVDFTKGCYVGQEVVSRMQHRGTARKRLIRIIGENDLPEAGSEILFDGKACGVLASHAGKEGLAMVRIDRVSPQADGSVPVMAGTQPATLRLQDWVGFTWPKD